VVPPREWHAGGFARDDDRYSPFVIFAVASMVCALAAGAVREVLPRPHLGHPPGLPAPLVGFLDLGRQAVPVLSLHRLFRLPAAEGSLADTFYQHLVIIEGMLPDQPVALLVDRVLNVARLPRTEIRPVAASNSVNGCVEAEIEQDGRLIHLLSASRLLLAEEQARLADISRAARERVESWIQSA
jgi:purine-binding chemotaxis protein CheW